MRNTPSGLVAFLAVLALAGSADAQIELVQRASSLSSPVLVTHAGDGSGILYVVEQPGRIAGVPPNAGPIPPATFLFLDIQNLVTAGGEQGLLGLAFHPDYPDTPFFFVNYTCEVSGAQPECTSNGDTIIARFRVGTNGIADPASRRTLLVIPQPFSNHNAGDLKFGPDGNLWIPMGDGGSGNDPSCFAQRDDSLLGKLLRIDVNQNVDSPPYYGIPAGNPYIGGGVPRDEVYARGLRNPFRFSFDRQTGDMFIGDVGQGQREEIDFQAAGTGAAGNYGWKVMEGTVCLGDGGTCPAGTPPCNSPLYTPPIVEVDHSAGDCAIIGGFRYRGSGIPAVAGRYFHSDNCTGRIRAATETSPGVWSDTVLLDTSHAISGFGEDEAGELYVTALGGGLYRLRAAGAGAGLSVNDVDVNPEGNAGTSSAVFTVTLGAPSAQTVTVQYATADGGATAGPDYTATSGTLTFTPSTTTRTVTVSVLGDTLDENNEGFFVNLSNPVNAIVDDGQGVGTIVDDDALPTLAAAGCSVDEGDVAPVSCTFSLTLAPASGRTVFVDYTATSGTATAGSDFTPASGTITFPDGATTRTVDVSVLADLEAEGDETFTLALTPVNATGGSSPTGTIVDNDQRETELTHGVTLRDNLLPPPDRIYRFAQAPQASYEVVLDEASGESVPLSLERVAADPTLVIQTAVPVGTGTRAQPALAEQHDQREHRRADPGHVARLRHRLRNGRRLPVARVRDHRRRIPRFNNTGTQVTVLDPAERDGADGGLPRPLLGPAGGPAHDRGVPPGRHVTNVLQTATLLPGCRERAARSASRTTAASGR